MIFPIIFFSISTVFGYLLAKHLLKNLFWEEMLVSGLVLGSLINTTTNFLLANIFGFSLFFIILSQIIFLIASIWLFLNQKDHEAIRHSQLSFVLATMALIGAFIFIPLFKSHMIHQESGDYYTGGATWGDLAFHITLVNSFALGENFPPQNPVFSGTRLTYAPLIDFLSAIFVKSGSSIQQALYIPGIIFAEVIFLLMFLFSFQLTKKFFISVITPVLFIFNGGIGLIYFVADIEKEGKDFLTALWTMTKEYAHLQDYNIRFSNVVADYFLPQRTFLLGFVVGILILIFILKYFEEKNKNYLVVSAFLSGLLPLIQPHSLVSVALIILFLIILNFKHRILFDFARAFLPMFLVICIIPILWILTSEQITGEFFRVQPFWMAANDNPLWFYFKNLGLVLPLIIIALFIVPKKLRLFYIPFAGLFVITNIFIFQPHDYDNMKIMLYWFLATLVLIAYFLEKLWTKRNLVTRTVFCLCLFFLTITGALSVLRESYTKYLMYDKEGLALAEQLRDITLPGDVILTSDQHNHPITSFSGRPVVMGYRGWLWTWGYDYRQRERDVLDIYQGLPQAKELLEKYNVSLIVIGETEKANFRANEDFFSENFELIFRTLHYKVYDAKDPI